MPLCSDAYLNVFSIRHRDRSQHSRSAPVPVVSLVRTCSTGWSRSNRVSCRAAPYPLSCTLSSVSITVTRLPSRMVHDFLGVAVVSASGARR